MFPNKILTIIILLAFGVLVSCTQKINKCEDLTFVPYPKELNFSSEKTSFDVRKITIQTKKETQLLAKLIENDLFRLSGKNAIENKGNDSIFLVVNPNLKETEYDLEVTKNRMMVTGGSYQAVSMGWTSILQSASFKNNEMILPQMVIKDEPDLSYRGLMLDLARQYHTPQTVKQIIDVCRWYKICNLHLHLMDEGTCVFPTDTFSDILKYTFHYTQEELKDIISYARMSGITIIPEMEGPGHSLILRRGYPELFGKKEYYMLDLSNKTATENMKKLCKEVMNYFPESPYFHISSDEVHLDSLVKYNPNVVKYIKKEKLDNIYDLYVKYIADMHEFLKEDNKQTIVWEGFHKDGSAKVKVPNDIIVAAFETLYERPDTLADYGYKLLNTSWKPLYVTRTRRWSPEKIYNWNYYTWGNFWELTPAAKEPIVLNDQLRKNIIGAQLCSWEQKEEMVYPAIKERLAAVSERLWNKNPMCDYQQFEPRMKKCAAKLQKLVYPFDMKVKGLVNTDYKGVYYNRENYFSDSLEISIKSNISDSKIYYTTNGSFPTLKSSVLSKKMTFTKTTFLKVCIYDEKGKLLSYYPVLFEKRPLKIDFIGDNHNDNNPDRCITFNDDLKIRIKQLPSDGSVHYTLDGSTPTVNSPEYISEISVKEPCGLRFQYFNNNGKAEGEPYGFFLCPQEKWNESIRRHYRW